MKNSISKFSKIILIVSAALLLIALFVPIWRIYLDAPQYPEGLSLEIWANGIRGNVEIINGLNHYIGMKTLHTEDFLEFTLLPYILVFFILLFLFTAFTRRKRVLYIVFWAFVIFGIIAMVDFWFWEYDYGHNLDPNAAIKVPGQSYQPPLIGFKQLLNFGAFSVPDLGGWFFVSAGILLLCAVLLESGMLSRFNKKSGMATIAIGTVVFFSGCNPQGPEPILLHKDACSSCKMTISDGKFGSEIITQKGRVYKFDDLRCMQNFMKENNDQKIASYYVHDFNAENLLIDASVAWFVQHESLRSPMGGNIAGFASKEAADVVGQKLNISPQSFSQLNINLPVTSESKEIQHHE